MEAEVLAKIRKLHDEVGTMNEDVLSELIRAEGSLRSHGFTFLRISDGFAVFYVPQQNIAAWYKGDRWLAAGKERIARKIVQKYKLRLFEPPDLLTVDPAYRCRQHFEFDASEECVIVAHPRYLKIRVSKWPHMAERTLLEDLSALYMDDTTANGTRDPAGTV